MVLNPGSENTTLFLTKNKYVINGSVITIFLTDKHGNDKGTTIVDLECANLVLNTTWRLSTLGYVAGNILGKPIKLHRLITNAPSGKTVDHINHNKLDNRKSNLRICENKENCRNRKLQHGVTFNKEKKRWLSRIYVDYKDIFLGYFEDYNDALKARKEAEQKYFGEFGGGQRG